MEEERNNEKNEESENGRIKIEDKKDKARKI